ncbi:phage terminase small subunit P27 family [Lactobacillus helveticus]|uniref:Phage terminase small subunit P27 family n=1 Tax=Lactobacillus helveticus TaxID=1587 RepID=A0A9Q5C031_LACHE|nr:phage terminase small subunit P27 family [Lactobacillus helveticus]NRN90938.1 hypothetical protein [Lactobacillus helveticus]
MKAKSKKSKVDLKQPNLSEDPPKYLGRIGKTLWRKLVPYLNENKNIIKADQYLLAQYCSAYDMYRTAYENVQEHGIQRPKYKTTLSPVDGKIVAKDFTGYAKNPSVQAMSDALNKMNSLGKELGLSPKSRNELINLKEPEKEQKKTSTVSELKKFFDK